MRKVHLLVLTSLLVSLAGCTKIKEVESSSTSDTQQTAQANTETSLTTQKETADTASAILNSEATDNRVEIHDFLGEWKLDVQGEEGYLLKIDQKQFQFFRLYDGHAVPPNNENVDYQLNTADNTLTMQGDRDKSESDRGAESVSNEKERETIEATMQMRDSSAVLIVTVNGKSVRLTTGDQHFIKVSEQVTIDSP